MKEGNQTIQQELEVMRRKSQFAAADHFDYRKLCKSCPGLLDCSLEQVGEELKLVYDIHGVFKWELLGRESQELKLAVLLDVEKLADVARQYCFVLAPENLYYDVHGRAYVCERDIYGERHFSEEEFLKQYKALIGCTLFGKYTFEDYCEGGMDLLKEDALTGKLTDGADIADTAEKLRLEYARSREAHRESYMEVRKKRYRAQRRGLFAVSILAAAAAALCVYLGAWERPYQQAVIAANEAYLRTDYEETVEALAGVDVKRMDVSQKYILAVSCVKCESFNNESQSNILNTVTLNGDEKVMEYWIYINRLDTEAAADIAMQLSSDQLLYYAYLKERTVVENDSSLTGAEKNARLEEIASKLQPLESEYRKLTEE